MLLGIRAKIRNGSMLAYREKFGLSQAEAAKLADVSHGTWNALECMRFDDPAIGREAPSKVAMALGVDLEQIAPEELVGQRLKTERIAYVEIGTDKLLNARCTSAPMLECEEVVDIPNIKQKLEAALKTLTHRERAILSLRYGLEDGATYTLEEVGRIMRSSKERVRLIEARAIRKLQHPTRAKLLEGLMDEQR